MQYRRRWSGKRAIRSPASSFIIDSRPPFSLQPLALGHSTQVEPDANLDLEL